MLKFIEKITDFIKDHLHILFTITLALYVGLLLDRVVYYRGEYKAIQERIEILENDKANLENDLSRCQMASSEFYELFLNCLDQEGTYEE